jgi:D-serine deaminase-like pyridoxal phosphate-dependent protein
VSFFSLFSVLLAHGCRNRTRVRVKLISMKSYTPEEIDRILDSGDIAGRLSKDDLPTPALLLDLDAFDFNVRKMADHARNSGRALRPHAKTHKCPQIARELIRAGAVGACAAKLSEAETMAAFGIGGLLVTAAIAGPGKIARAVHLAKNNRDIIFTTDSAENVRQLNDAAATVKCSPPLVVNLAVELLLFPRTGVAPGEPALALAQLIDSLPHVSFSGLQAYDGASAHVVGFENRRRRSLESMSRAVETRCLLERHGIACELLTGGSTGTYNIDTNIDGITEIQPGSFLFMDVEYGKIGGQDGPVYRDFRTSLTVLSTVIHSRAGVAIVDAGVKAFATDTPFAPELKNRGDIAYIWAGDEYGRLELSAGGGPQYGDRLEFVVPHCDPTVNLYDRIFGVRGECVELAWPIAARGKSQ